MNDDTLIIRAGPTRITIDADEVLSNKKYFHIHELKWFCKRVMTAYEFIPKTKRYVETSRFYEMDKSERIFKMPIAFLDELIEHLNLKNLPYRTVQTYDYPPRDIKFDMVHPPYDYQVPAIDHIINSGSRSALALRMGRGKTMCAMAALSKIGKAALVIMEGKLCDQWVRSFLKDTTIPEEKLYIVKGADSIKLLLDMDEEDYPDVLVCTLETIRSYMDHGDTYDGLPTFNEFVKLLGIGVKVIDEAHKCFHANCRLDMAADIPHNIYLTATFVTSDRSIRRIFRVVFPDEIQYKEDDNVNYLNVYFYAFRGAVPEKKCLGFRSFYSHIKYEQYLLKRPKLLNAHFNKVLAPMIRSHYLNREELVDKKLLIYCSTVDMVHAVLEFVGTLCNKSTLAYIAGVPDDLLAEYDVIGTTPKRCGEGTDIPRLITCINTISFAAITLANQIPGRIRDPKDKNPEDEDEAHYADMFDQSVRAQVKHYGYRSGIVKLLAKKYREFRL